MAEFYIYNVPKKKRPSPTLSAGQMATAAKKQGKDVDIVTVGDLFPKPTRQEIAGWVAQFEKDSKNPPADKKELYDTIRSEENKFAYSEGMGMPSLRSSVGYLFRRDSGIDGVTGNDVGIGVGGKGALNGAFYNTLCDGGVVFVAVPGWPSNFDIFPPGVKIVEIPTKDGILRAPDLEAALKKHPNPNMVLINAPCNPTGANYTPAEREAFFKIIATNPKAQNTIVASDDPYGKLVFDRNDYDPSTVLRRGPEEKAVFNTGREAVFRTVSKEYGLAGDRVGFVVTKNKGMLESLGIWNEDTGGLGTINQDLAQAALIYGDEFITRTVGELKEKRQVLTDGIGQLKFATMEMPGGTIYGWVDFAGLKGKKVPDAMAAPNKGFTIATPADMMTYLVNVAGVCPVPGVPFFAPDSPAGKDDWHVRISFCCPRAQLEKVVTKLQNTEQMLDRCQKKGNGVGFTAPE